MIQSDNNNTSIAVNDNVGSGGGSVDGGGKKRYFSNCSPLFFFAVAILVGTTFCIIGAQMYASDPFPGKAHHTCTVTGYFCRAAESEATVTASGWNITVVTVSPLVQNETGYILVPIDYVIGITECDILFGYMNKTHIRGSSGMCYRESMARKKYIWSTTNTKWIGLTLMMSGAIIGVFGIVYTTTSASDDTGKSIFIGPRSICSFCLEKCRRGRHENVLLPDPDEDAGDDGPLEAPIFDATRAREG